MQIQNVTNEKNQQAQQFASKDKESLEHDLNSQKLSEQVSQTSSTLQQVSREKEVLQADKLELTQLVEQLKAQVQ